MLTLETTEAEIREALKQVIDPELGVNIVDLGLVYGVDIVGRKVFVTMTLTTPGCPLHAGFAQAIEAVVTGRVPDVDEVVVDLVFDPPWSADRITPAGQKALGWS